MKVGLVHVRIWGAVGRPIPWPELEDPALAMIYGFAATYCKSSRMCMLAVSKVPGEAAVA